jgi:DNA-binding transcriptional LysR family regulator
MKATVQDFIDFMAEMTLEQWETVRQEAREQAQARIDAHNATSMSAADFSWLDKRVRSFRPAVLDDADPGTRVAAKNDLFFACYAIVLRSKMSDRDYHLLVDPFVVAGVVVPDFVEGE